MSWAVKYKPRSLKDFVNQKEAVEHFLAWIQRWKPGAKALLFHGVPGTGKTALVEAYAAEEGVDLIEMNASDFRSASRVDHVLGRSMMQASLFGKGKLLLVDEVDGLAGNEDAGGVEAIIKVVRGSRHPVVLTANNPYEPRLRSLRTYCELVQFRKITVWDIVKRLTAICRLEGVSVYGDALRMVASRSEGDLRSAITDLETLARRDRRVTEEDLVSLGFRERETSVFEALTRLFKARSVMEAKLSISDVDKDPDELFWWIETNIADEYEDPGEVAKAFQALSKADLFKQRVASRQNWRLQAYTFDLMTAGVSLAKKEVYRKFTRYRYPDLLMILGRTRGQRAANLEAHRKLADALHCSTRVVRGEFLPYLRIMVKNPGFERSLGAFLGLAREELHSVV